MPLLLIAIPEPSRCSLLCWQSFSSCSSINNNYDDDSNKQQQQQQMARNDISNHEQSLQDQNWTKMLTRLQAYQQEHNGSCNVPCRYPQDPQLGRWINKQRERYEKGMLTKERFDQLEEIGFEWTVFERTEWTEMIKRLQAYQREHNGSCNVPCRFPQDPKLGNWVKTQRHLYKKGLLAKERFDPLEEIGFEWACNREQAFQDQWTKMFKTLQAYQKEHIGSCNVPWKYPPDPKLANWVVTQRHLYKQGSLAKERCDQLSAIGFEWRSSTRTNHREQEAKMQSDQSGTTEGSSRRWCWL